MCCFNCFCPKKKRKENKTDNRSFGSSVSHSASTLEQKTSQAVLLASSPSRLPTTDLTLIYDIPNTDFKCEDDVIHSHGYEILKKELLGKGSYARVYKAKRIEDQTMVACKEMEISEKAGHRLRTDAKNELFVMAKTSHPHIVRIFSHFLVNNMETKKSSVFLFMQLADNNSLSAMVRNSTPKVKFDESTCRRMFAQMVSAVSHMHNSKIAHRDLKMGNILLDRDFNVLVADFGLSRVAFRQSKGGTLLTHEFVGTLPYMAPEILVIRVETIRPYSPFLADVWALGVILYAMANKKYPFGDENTKPQEMIKNQLIFTNNFSNYKLSRNWNQRSKDFEDIIQRIFTYEAQTRITVKDLLKHNWICDEINTIDKKIEEQGI